MEKNCKKGVKIIDCTIRDGGLINNFRFEDKMVKGVYEACKEAGIDYMEIGYKASTEYFSYNEFGLWKFCREEEIRRVLGEEKSGVKLSVMADVGRTNLKEDILPKQKSIIDMIRVAAYIEQVEEAVEMIKDLSDKGYETTLNLMAASKVEEKELDKALLVLSKSDVNAVYLVDSFGALYTEDTKKLTNKYVGYMGAVGKEVGIHAHNNRQMAYANTLEAINSGATFVDATMAGMGRGAGNCPLELILGCMEESKYKMRPVIKCVQDEVMPLKSKINWGFDIAYMLTGQYNLHPRPAIAFLKEASCEERYVEFYDEVANL